jgi:hypothetical protein
MSSGQNPLIFNEEGKAWERKNKKEWDCGMRYRDMT